MYNYMAKLIRVVDGDTVYLDVDLGFTVHINVGFRLAGINAPEMIGATHDAGLAAKRELERLLSLGQIQIYSEKEKAPKTDKYGRWLARLWVTQTDSRVLDVNQSMIDGGFAVPYMV
jgi:micrococcal nuclease